jgi:hypothetical protein
MSMRRKNSRRSFSTSCLFKCIMVDSHRNFLLLLFVIRTVYEASGYEHSSISLTIDRNLVKILSRILSALLFLSHSTYRTTIGEPYHETQTIHCIIAAPGFCHAVC